MLDRWDPGARVAEAGELLIEKGVGGTQGKGDASPVLSHFEPA